MDLFVEDFEFCFSISVRVEQVEALLEFIGKGAFEQFLHSLDGDRSVGVHRLEGRNGGTDLRKEGTDVVGLFGIAGMTNVYTVFKIGVRLDVNATKVGAGSQHIRHTVNRGCDRQARHSDRVKHGTASLG